MPEHMTKAEAYMHLRRLLTDHGLGHWKITWNRRAKQAGYCQHSTSTIAMSLLLLERRPYMDSMQTITHEIAHAVVGPGHGHNVIWQAKHRELGGNGQQCFTFKDEQAPWMAECGHGCSHGFYRRPTRTYRCRKHKILMTLRDQRKATIAAQKASNDVIPVN